MRIVAPILAGGLLIATAVAQDPVDQKPDKTTAAARLQELEDLQQQAVAEWRKSIEAARAAAKEAKPGTALPAMSMRPDLGPVVAKAKQFAAEFAGSDDAVPFLTFIVRNAADKTTSREVIDTLLDKHLDSAKLAEIGGMIPYIAQIVDAKFAEYAIARLVRSADANVRGWALFARHKPDIEDGDRASERYTLAKQELLKAVAAASDERLADEVRSAIDLREKFGLGATAPDIEGVDLDGVAFKLSDYKGKVVFLDFWGDW